MAKAIDPENEIQTLSTEDYLKQDLKKYNLPDAKINQLKKDYAGLSVIDNQTLESAKKARQEVRSYRISVEAKRKELKAVSMAYGQGVDAEAKRLTALLQEIEEPVDKQIKKFEEIKEQEKAEKRRLFQEKINLRISQLGSAGVSFNGSQYTDGADLTLSPLQLEDMPDDQFTFFVKMAESAAAEKAALAAEIENKRLADLAELEAAKLEIKKQQDAIELQKKQMQDQADQLAAQQKKIDDQKIAEAQMAKSKLFSARSNVLTDLGFSFSRFSPTATKSFSRVCSLELDVANLADFSDENFEIFLESVNKDLDEKYRENDKEEELYKKTLQEQADAKALADLEEKQKQEKAAADAKMEAKLREAQLAPDKEKLKTLSDLLRCFTDDQRKTEFKTKTSEKIHAETIVLLEKTYTFVLDKINTLR